MGNDEGLTPSEHGSSAALRAQEDAVEPIEWHSGMMKAEGKLRKLRKLRKLTKPERETVRQKYAGRCAYCGDQLGARWHADHFEPVLRRSEWCTDRKKFVATGEMYKSQRDVVSNMMPACAPCNIDKASFTLEQWRHKLADGVGVLNRSNSTYRHMKRFGLVSETGAQIVFHFEQFKLDEPRGLSAADEPSSEGVK